MKLRPEHYLFALALSVTMSAVCWIGGCAASPPVRSEFDIATKPEKRPTTRPLPAAVIPVLYVSSQKEFEPWIDDWMVEWRQRFGDNLVIVVGHGNTARGQWMIYTENHIPIPVAYIAGMVREDWPDRTIVFFVCNPGDETLKGVTNVAYAHDTIWKAPDWLFSPEEDFAREVFWGAGVGRADEFRFVPATRPATVPATRASK